MALPNINYSDTKYIKGVKTFEGSSTILEYLPYSECLSKKYTTDAHFVTYTIPNLRFGRLTKDVLPEFTKRGHKVLSTMVVVDYDNPDHKPWTRESLKSWLEQLQELNDNWEISNNWTTLYTTRNGARLIYVLTEPVPVLKASQKSAWFSEEFVRQGMEVDTTVCDWTRMFRLPYVNRDGINTWEEENTFLLINEDTFLDPDTLHDTSNKHLNIAPVDSSIYIEELNEMKPTDYECFQLLNEMNDKGKPVLSDFAKNARRSLKKTAAYGVLFNREVLAHPEGPGRNNAIHSMVGVIVGKFFSSPKLRNYGAKHVYALLLEPTLKLKPDADTPDWTDVLWSSVSRIWPKHKAKQKVTEEFVKDVKETKPVAYLMDSIITGVKSWTNGKIQTLKKDELEEWIKRRLIVSINNFYAIMRTDGYYDSIFLRKEQLIARIRTTNMDRVIPTYDYTSDEGQKDLHPTTLINNYCTVVNEMEAYPGITGSYIKNIDESCSVLAIPSFRRSPSIKSEYSEEVETWLKLMFDKDFDRVCQWIAYALAFDEGPICALSMYGKQGSGKKMFVQGLAECLETPRLADAEDLVGNYQYGLLESPFLVVNEGWPHGAYQTRHPADQFRALVSGDVLRVQRKYMPPTKIKSPVRVIFTSNNQDIVRFLIGSKDLLPADREALALRLIHLHIDDKASLWLTMKGGVRYTKGWIAGDSGQQSNYTIAKHFMWLYENRNIYPTGKRFLVEGDIDNEDLNMEMRTRAGSSPIVIETIIKLIEENIKRDGIAIENNIVYVLTKEILEYYRSNIQRNTKTTLTNQSILDVLRGLMLKETTGPFQLKSRANLGRRWWHILDAKLLYTVAQKDGWACPKLELLLKKKELDVDKCIEKPISFSNSPDSLDISLTL